MKDIVRVGLFVAVEEPSGKTAKVIGSVISGIIKKYEPQITRIIDAVTNELTEKNEKSGEKK